jgi:hypothetical protein
MNVVGIVAQLMVRLQISQTALKYGPVPEPDALIAHVRICGGPGRATALGYPTPGFPHVSPNRSSDAQGVRQTGWRYFRTHRNGRHGPSRDSNNLFLAKDNTATGFTTRKNTGTNQAHRRRLIHKLR